jgi:hypothetical protein
MITINRTEQNSLEVPYLRLREMCDYESLSPYRLGTVDGIVKKNMPGKLFFFSNIYQFLCNVHKYVVPRGVAIYG